MTALTRASLLACFMLGLWQALITLWQLPNYLLPSPGEVLLTFYHQAPLITAQSIPTLVETLLGFLLGILSGCLAGGILAFSRPLARWCLPLLIVSQAIPAFAIAPLLVIWLGYGLASKIAVAVLMIFFPIASAFYDGLNRTPPAWLEMACIMKATKWRQFWYIRIPSALPTLASGIRIAAVTAPIGAIVGEWVGASKGLGYLMLTANARMQIDMMFAALLIIVIIALGLYFTVDKLLRTFIWWEN
ncbi:MAG: ABC transporter permease [Gammaproteobacteria bacterium RIFCSPHIGHO2_12_FULL_45_12]|nr:MAG: ABC transporter permease [Gammaproteobacteria bacterium RIFCSPHIGHO2_12_FULL_45_12]